MNIVLMFLVSISVLFGCSSRVGSLPVIPPDERGFELIEEIPGKNRLEIFNLSREWMSLNFRSSESVIDYEDIDSGKIVGKGITNYAWGGGFTGSMCPHLCKFVMNISIKDEKIRIVYDNFIGSFPPCNKGRMNWGPLRAEVHVNSVRTRLADQAKALIRFINKGHEKKDW